MDIFSAIVVLGPLLIPLGLSYGIHPVHLGIVFLANLELGYLTPPVGINLFLGLLPVRSRPAPDLPHRGAVPVAAGGGGAGHYLRPVSHHRPAVGDPVLTGWAKNDAPGGGLPALAKSDAPGGGLRAPRRRGGHDRMMIGEAGNRDVSGSGGPDAGGEQQLAEPDAAAARYWRRWRVATWVLSATVLGSLVISVVVGWNANSTFERGARQRDRGGVNRVHVRGAALVRGPVSAVRGSVPDDRRQGRAAGGGGAGPRDCSRRSTAVPAAATGRWPRPFAPTARSGLPRPRSNGTSRTSSTNVEAARGRDQVRVLDSAWRRG